jgi:hypothetical protein
MKASRGLQGSRFPGCQNGVGTGKSVETKKPGMQGPLETAKVLKQQKLACTVRGHYKRGQQITALQCSQSSVLPDHELQQIQLEEGGHT